MKLFEDTTPLVVKAGNIRTTREQINIMRPSRYSNPFVKGMYFSIRELYTCLGKVEWLRGLVITEEFVKEVLPVCYRKASERLFLTKVDCIEMFDELWCYGVENGLITQKEILNFENKALVCNCAPARCHGDVLVKSYLRIKGK